MGLSQNFSSTKLTVGELIEKLSAYDSNLEIYFGGLEPFGLDQNGDDVNFEFCQTVRVENGKVVVDNHRDVL